MLLASLEVFLFFFGNFLFMRFIFQVRTFLAIASFFSYCPICVRSDWPPYCEHKALNWNNIIILPNLQKYIWPLRSVIFLREIKLLP